MKKQPNTKPTFSSDALRSWKLFRFNPIKGLRPDTLARYLDNFEAGDLRDTALLFQSIEERDDVIKVVGPKRKGSVARQSWSINTVDDSPAAAKQKEVLEHFYNNVTTKHATELDQQGGFRLLLRQMMDAVGKRYAVHEIVWHPGKHGLSAEFRFVPLWFFENRTGKLRFKQHINATQGEDMEPGNWMVTVGPGVMVASSIAYLYKTEPLKDWLVYSARCGMPGVKGKTNAAYNSDEWNAVVDAVDAFAAEWAAVFGDGADIETVDMTAKGTLPYPELVERMDRGLVTLWRGADLSTLSKGEGMGASLQQDESDILLEDDVEMVNETLNIQVDRAVIDYHFGEGVEQLAYIEVAAPDRLDEKAEQEKLHAAADYGVPVDMPAYCETLNIDYDADKVKDAVLKPPSQSALPVPPAAEPLEEEELEEAANEVPTISPATLALARALQNDFAAVDEQLAALENASSADELLAAMERLRDTLPELGQQSLGGQTEKVLETLLADAAVQAAVETAKKAPQTV